MLKRRHGFSSTDIPLQPFPDRYMLSYRVDVDWKEAVQQSFIWSRYASPTGNLDRPLAAVDDRSYTVVSQVSHHCLGNLGVRQL